MNDGAIDELKRSRSDEGWTVVRFWEHDIKFDAQKLAGRVKRVVRKSGGRGRRA
jgi:hypothetical protein